MRRNLWFLIIIFLIILLLFVVFSIKNYQNIDKTIEGYANHNKSIKSININDEFILEKVVEAEVATDIIFLKDGRMLWSELNSGKIMQFINGESSTFSTIKDSLIPSEFEGEAGIMGMAVDGEFEKYSYVYVYYSSNGKSKIVRFEDVDGKGENMKVIFEDIVQGKIHNGGPLLFGPDNRLYVATGDATKIKKKLWMKNPSQNISLLNGKVLRMDRNGGIPPDNPFGNSYIFAYGLRNPYAFDFHPKTEKLYVADQGIDCCEEITILDSGDNSGWPFEMGFVEGSEYKQPSYVWDGLNRVSPTGLAFYNSIKHPKYLNKLFMTTWKTSQIYVFEINGEDIITKSIYIVPPSNHQNLDVKSIKAHEDHGHFFKGLLDIEVSPNGEIFFSDIEHIFKITPKLKNFEVN